MKFKRENLMLYGITDRSWLHGKTLVSQVEQALLGGVTCLQLREKELPLQEFLREAGEVRQLCSQYHVPLIINDSVEIAKAVDADGVHVGQSDMEIRKARQLLGPDKVIGASARTVEQALLAQEQGADYLGVGAVFPTGTKKDAKPISCELLREICAAVSIPVAAIGGITKDNLHELAGSGISGVAVVSAIFARQDIRSASEQLRSRIAALLDDSCPWVAQLSERLLSSRGVVFDVDGTLLDSMPVWEHAGERYLSGLGILAPADLSGALFSMTMQQGAAYLRQRFHLPQSEQEIIDGVHKLVGRFYAKEVGPKPGMRKLLEQLRRSHIPMIAVTATDKPLIEAAFERLGMDGFFVDILTCSEYGSGKDEPEIFYEAIRRLGATAQNARTSDIWVVEDGLYAMRTAKEIGCSVAGVFDAASADDQAKIQDIADVYVSQASCSLP